MFKFTKIQPLFTGVVTTAMTYKSDQMTTEGGLVYDVSKKKGDLNIYQRVVAVGNMVKDVKEGDIVRLNYKRYAIAEHKPGSIDNNIQKDNMGITYLIPKVELDGVDYLFLQNNDIEFIVLDPQVDDGGLLE